MQHTAKRLERELTEAEYEYVLFHLNMHVDEQTKLKSIISYTDTQGNGVYIPRSAKDVEILSHKATEIYITEGENLIFKTDIIKAAFYLLSGYQEFEDNDLDEWGRPKWENSIQHELNCTRTPLVNYYFRWILDACEKYSRNNNVHFTRRNIFGRPILHLTHDIDNVRYYTPQWAAYRWAQTLGLKPCTTDKLKMAKSAWNTTTNVLGLTKKPNPWWSFDEMIGVENYYGFKSTWFILPNDGGPFSADYKWSDNDIISLLNQIERNGGEIGLHGPIKCQTAEAFVSYIEDASDIKMTTHRQHFLATNSKTIQEIDKAGIEVDCSLGYSHSEGFRNGYCLPFHPFDHERQKMLSLWEIPLTLMEVSILQHRKLTYDEIYEVVGELLDEVREFNGVFSLLWHNSTFDETYFPGIQKFYEELHYFFTQYQMESMTTKKIIETIKTW